MEEIPLLLGNICAICYESASTEYLQKRWISCRIRRVFSCCCSRHLIAESADALSELLRGGAAAIGGLEEERGRTKNDGKKIPERRGTSSRMSSRQTVFSSSEEKLHTTPSERTLSSGVVVVVLELCFAVVALILLHQALDSVFFLQNPGSVRSVHPQVACKPWLFVCLFAFSPSRCEASSSAGRKQNGRAS
jgi:hypothetical protein